MSPFVGKGYVVSSCGGGGWGGVKTTLHHTSWKLVFLVGVPSGGVRYEMGDGR